ncbi:zuotin [Martiniozyma asiatica (nom. inval.)]|nr:hypothetical protein DAMA08_027050 [Martiniozyma asiatica]GMM31529.1 zuotin [Martiniozyma asiatica]
MSFVLPSAPSGTAIGKYSKATNRPLEPIGPQYLAHATRILKNHTWSEYEQHVASLNLKTAEDVVVDEDEALFDTELADKSLLTHDPRDWKSADLYAALSLSKLRHRATPDQIVKAHRKSVLEHHPDKQAAKGIQGDGFFKIIQKAYETLLDSTKRRQFDSVDEEAHIEPPAKGSYNDETFFAAWGPVFESEGRFSTKQPVLLIGNADTEKKDVDAFYKFWNNFDSWRSFEFLDEDVPDDTSNRDHKRYIEKKNNNARKKKKTEDNKRVSDLVKRAQSEDPRIKKFKEDEKAEKARKKWEREAGAREAEEKAKAEAEAAAKAHAEAEASAKSGKEAAKKAKEAAKNAKKKNKRAVRAACKDAGFEDEADAFLELLNDEKLAQTVVELNNGDAKQVLGKIAQEVGHKGSLAA